MHGANRLASNSLLECLVYGARAGTHAATFAALQPSPPPDILPTDHRETSQGSVLEADLTSIEVIKEAIQETLWENVSIERNGEGLRQTLAELQDLTINLGDVPAVPESSDVAMIEAVNMLNVALMITQSALTRTESRGAHYRADFPTQDDTDWQHRILISRDNPPEVISLE